MPDPVAPDPFARTKSWTVFVLGTVGYVLGCGLITYMVVSEVRTHVVPPAYLVAVVGFLVGGGVITPALSPAIARIRDAVRAAIPGKKGA